jgi:transcriptional regulator with XRE-family HTH domain
VSERGDFGVHLRLFGEAVAAARKSRGIGYSDLSRTCGLPDTILRQVENGIALPRGFGVAEICRMATALGLTPSELMERYEAALRPGSCWWEEHHEHP